MELIDKTAVENILKELWIEDGTGNSEHRIYYNQALQEVQCKLDSLEVKEVDLKKEIYEAEKRFGDIDEMGGYRILIFDDEFRDILHHFFELGRKSQKGE